jgi:hypothetical protein
VPTSLPTAWKVCMEGSDEEGELKTIVDCFEAYEIKRWPLGKEPDGKG